MVNLETICTSMQKIMFATRALYSYHHLISKAMINASLRTVIRTVTKRKISTYYVSFSKEYNDQIMNPPYDVDDKTKVKEYFNLILEEQFGNYNLAWSICRAELFVASCTDVRHYSLRSSFFSASMVFDT